MAEITSENPPANIPAVENPPQNPAEKPLQNPNDTQGTSNTVKNSFVEKIRRATASTVEKFQVAVKGTPGRPRKADHELKYPRREKRQENPFSNHAGNAGENIPQPGAKTIAVDFPGDAKTDIPPAAKSFGADYGARFSRSIHSILQGAFAFGKTVTKWLCEQAEISSDGQKAIEPLLEADKEALEHFSNDLEIVRQKYNYQPKYMEEMALAGSTARLFKGYAAVAVILVAEIRRKRAREKQAERAAAAATNNPAK